jgi:hypothetical protein
MRLIPVLVIAAALCALPSVSAGGTSSTATAGVAAKKCGKHKHHRKGHHKRRCKRGQNGGSGGAGGGSGSGGGANCANTASSPGRAAAYESEYQIQLSRPSVGCGTVILEQNTISAMDPHNLVLQKEGDPSPSYTYDELGPGSYTTQTLNLSRGNWVLYCSLLDHRARGMEVTLRVD